MYDLVVTKLKRLFFILYFFIERMLFERCVPCLPIVAALADGHMRYRSAIIRIKHSCGHVRWRREFGDASERENKRKFLQSHECAECWANNWAMNKQGEGSNV